MGGEQLFFVNDPQHIKDILVTHNKSFMKGRGLAARQAAPRRRTADQRRRDPPAAAPADAAGVSSRSHRRLRRGDGRVRGSDAERRGSTARTLDVAGEMNRLTLSIVGKTLFDADVESQATRGRRRADRRHGHVLDDDAAVRRRASSGCRCRSCAAPAMARVRLDAIIYRMIAERRASGRDHGDLLSMLLARAGRRRRRR